MVEEYGNEQGRPLFWKKKENKISRMIFVGHHLY